MKNSSSQNYSYALDAENNLIHVSSAVREARYFCPHCRALMTPHMGKIRRWHFTHKANIENCNYETYLHKIAKSKIREAFVSASEFIISYDVPAVCNRKESCIINKGDRCICNGRIEHDIRQFYDTCEEEVPYKNFVADLLLSSLTHPNREPILIEIYVSHKSTQEKITDGVRIIEVQIRSEEDITEIVSSLKIEGDMASDRYYFRDEKPKTFFYNFKGSITKPPSYFNKMIPNFIYYLWMYDSGYFKADKCLCDEDPAKYIPNNAHFITCSESFSWSWAFLEFIKRGVDVKNCLVCKYSSMTSMSLIEERICTLYKKFGTPRHPGINTAKTCQYFRRIKEANQNTMFISPEEMENPNAEPNYTIVVRKDQQ